MSRIPRTGLARDNIKAWCMIAFGRGMAAQAAKAAKAAVGSPQQVFDLWWVAVAGPDPKPAKKTEAWPVPYPVGGRTLSRRARKTGVQRAKRGGGR